MKKIIFFAITFFSVIACSKYPIDEDGLMITDRNECYVSNFELLGRDHQVAYSKAAEIDTIAQTINIEVQYGADLKNLWPRFFLCPDAKLEPKITDYVDFSDLQPKEWTVISGNRKVRKTYTVTVTVQEVTNE